MGAELIQQSPLARYIIQDLEIDLAQLPEEDRPTWSLEAEILAVSSVSRISESAISHPLNAAVQIMLVDLLRSANVHFDAVVGHSGGEVGAAYAAGYLTARDALYVAYYRGLSYKHAASPNGSIRGAMVAVGTSMEDATHLCEEEEFAGRITVAAINSSSSVTISGDEDAIEELQVILEDEKKFNRRLRVDQAYHSKHMLPCAGPYVEGKRRVGIKAQSPSLSHHCTWFSSVYDGRQVDLSFGLSDVYWAENMVRPVLFSQALTSAISSDTLFDVVLEIGPHPALKGPSSQTIQDVLHKPIPYEGLLSRGNDAIETLSTSLGFLWSHLDRRYVSLECCEVAMSGKKQRFSVLKGLPTYQWNQETKYWHESRRSRHMRLRQQPFHPLLGDASPDSGPHLLRWKNVLKPSEMQWIEGHVVQNQIVFPATGYVATALEAAQVLADGKSIRLIELSNISIHQAIMFDGNDTGVEVQIELSQISKAHPNCILAKFTYFAALGGENTDLALAADAEVKVSLGETSHSVLPQRQSTPPHMIPLDASRLYSFMESLEYNFSGPFRSLVSLKRKLGQASCVAKSALSPDCDSLLVHPVDLDAAFQSIMLAYSYPGDGQLRILHLPTSIAKVRVNPAILASQKHQDNHMDVESTCNPEDRIAPGSGFSGNVNMYSNGCSNAAIQVDQVKFKPVGTTANDDRDIFYKMHFVPSKPDGTLAADGIPVTKDNTDLLWVLSRIANFYLRQFDRDVPENSLSISESPLCHYLNYARHMTNLFKRGENKYARNEWLNDTLEDVMDEIKAKGVTNNSDAKIMLLVGETMPRVFKNETTMLEHFRTSGLLDEYYAHGFGTMQLLEIGAETGGATKNILHAIDHNFDSYTFTDISSSFFENAAEALAPWGDSIVFKTCDAERDPLEQGFAEGAYDVIIAYMVVHATAKLNESMLNLRKLLKPGGFLVIGEGSSDGALQAGAGFIFGTLPGWWRGVDEGRNMSPLINVPQWDAILKRTGFSGIDTISPPRLFDTFGITLFVSQAVDAKIDLVREPLSFSADWTIREVIIVGGQTVPVFHIAEGLTTIFTGLGSQVYMYKTLEKMDDKVLNTGSTIISLTDLDWPVFKDITLERWYNFKRLFEGEKTVLWLTSGRLEDEPYCNMTVGFGRSAAHEEDDLRLQFLDIPDPSKVNDRTIAETLLRFTLRHLGGEDVLYTVEPEIVMDAKGNELVPRLSPILAVNNRLNSSHRPITHEVDVSKCVVELRQESNSCFVRQLSRYETSEKIKGSKLIEIRTTHAVLSAVWAPIGHQFLALGVDATGTRYLTLVSFLTSILHVPEDSAVPCDFLGFSMDVFLALIAAQLVAMAIVDFLFAGQTLVVHNALGVLAQAISAQASVKGIEVIFVTDCVDTESIPSSWIKLPPYLGRSNLSQLLPADIACFVGFSTNNSENELTILSTLSPYCRKENTKTIYSSYGLNLGISSPAILGQTFSRAAKYIQSQVYNPTVKTVSLEMLAGGELPDDPLTIIHWTAATSLPARVTRFDIKPLLKEDKTYWLCGLSGALGISLCDWMIDRGVRNLVLTSRNPKIDPAWLEDHKCNGVTVKILSCDVTNEKALKAVHQTIVESLPPIVGVLNGAMVLRDVTVRNMAFDQVVDVIRPKVLGSMDLDRIFHDINLDFFVFLSSINCVIGNVGQANYAAANMGMCGVAANRRKRGLVSSVVNVGAIIGVGYITQSARQLDVTVANTHMIHLSEEDFHQIFTEAMEAGYLDSPNGPELSIGLLQISPDSTNIPKWYSDPKFACLIVQQTASSIEKKEQTNAASIQDSLQGCQSEQDVLQVIKQAFAIQLRKTLRISTADDDLMSMRSINLGLDSLISVDIRSWFLKNFLVSIPVLKIMVQDAQMAGLAEAVAEGIPAELVPQVRDGKVTTNGDESSAASTPVTPASATNCESPRSMATTTGSVTSADGDTLKDGIDWDAEACPPEGIAKLMGAKPPNLKPSVILLTGCSGLLGHHLLNTLMTQPTIRKVICVAVRQLSERLKANQLPPSNDRIVYYEGDLGLPRFGLSQKEEAIIFNEVDAVIHNGADTSHLKYYHALRDTNVESTHQLVRLCLQRMIPLHYISSAGIALFAGIDAFPEISATTTEVKPPANGAHGYMCGKWVSERLLERVNAAYGLKVCIQRPSTIIREGDDATTAKANFDWVNALLHFSHRIQAVPRVEHNKRAFDLVYVQSVCADIVRHLLDNKPRLDNGVTYVNNVGDIVIPMDRLAELAMQKGKKELYKVVPMGEWIHKAMAAGLHPAVAALIETFDEPGTARYPRLLKARV